jgi:PAS domain S-box-containing protein
METKFELTEKDYRYLFENASDAIWVQDMDGNFLDGNRALEKLSGYTLEELAGKNITQFLSDEFLALAKEVQRRLLAGEDIDQPYEQRFLVKGGRTRIVKMATNPIIINGEVKGFQHVARDVTEEKQLQENMRFYVHQVTRAQEDERKRIARELHDSVSPPLLLLAQGLDMLSSTKRPKLSNSALKQALEGLRSQAIEALETLRRCAQDLRPRILDDLGLVAALEWMTEDMVKSQGIDAYAEVMGVEQTLPVETQLLLFRIVQEALNNIRTHAEASRVVVKLEFGDNRIKMTVSDNGKGFELPERMGDLASVGKLGLAGMQERARLLGGSLKVESELGKGTRVAVEAPV